MAASTRTSTLRARSSPTGRTSPSCSTRSSLAWALGASSPTSSSRMVPPSASPNSPGRERMAPVKAPLAWPNSSASASSGERAAQLKRTNGRSARREASTIASATLSLPVPLSPVMSTVTSRGATRPTSTPSRRIASEAKTIERARVSSPSSFSFS